jgi:hypothetical protein
VTAFHLRHLPHLLITPQVEISRLTQSLKRFTARQGNKILGLTGQSFWQDESFDRLVRDDEEFQRITRYIEMNPVNAGLVAKPENYPWSSAGPIDNRPAGFQPAPQSSEGIGSTRNVARTDHEEEFSTPASSTCEKLKLL